MSSQHFPFRQSEEDHEHPSQREQFTMAAHDLADHDQFGYADEGHDHNGAYLSQSEHAEAHVRHYIRVSTAKATGGDGTYRGIHDGSDRLSVTVPSWATRAEAIILFQFRCNTTTPGSQRVRISAFGVDGLDIGVSVPAADLRFHMQVADSFDVTSVAGTSQTVAAAVKSNSGQWDVDTLDYVHYQVDFYE